MKNFFKLITYNLSLIAVLFTFHCSAQWYIQPSGTNANLWSVFFTDSTNGWAVGDGGVILKYDGTQWNSQISGTCNSLNSVYFINKDTGFAVGGYGGIILNTTDGGKDWSLRELSPNYAFYSICFPDKNVGYIVGDSTSDIGIEFKSTDGGNNWYRQYKDLMYNFVSTSFINTNIGYILGAYSLQKTTDGGNTWILPDSSTLIWGNFVHFLNKDTGFIVGATYPFI